MLNMVQWNIITILLWWIPTDTSNPVYQIGDSQGIPYLVQPPATLYQMGSSLGISSLVAKNKISLWPKTSLFLLELSKASQEPNIEASRPTITEGLGGVEPPSEKTKNLNYVFGLGAGLMCNVEGRYSFRASL